MSKEIARRDFLKAAAAGAAGFVAAGALGGVTAFLPRKKRRPACRLTAKRNLPGSAAAAW